MISEGGSMFFRGRQQASGGRHDAFSGCHHGDSGLHDDLLSDLQAPSALAILYHAGALAPECHSHTLGIIAPPLGPRLHHGSM